MALTLRSRLRLASTATRARAARLAPVLVLCAAVLVGVQSACRSMLPPVRVTEVPLEASAALEEARAWLRGSEPVARERAFAAAQRAQLLAPDWVAPRRMLDDFENQDLLGIEALAGHRASLVANPDDAAEQYLAGRLEGDFGAPRFERAVALDPDLAWGHHGLAYMAGQRGDHGLASTHAQRALARARDPWERTYFTSRLAFHYTSSDRRDRALELLGERIADPEIAPVDMVQLSVQSALIELSMVFQPEYKRGYARALELLRAHDLTDAEVESLVRRLRLFRGADNHANLELQLALSSRSSPARDLWRAEMMLDSRSTPLALGLLRRAREKWVSGGRSDRTLLRAARFAAGQYALAVEEWARDQPRVVLDHEGLPQDPALRNIVEHVAALRAEGGASAAARTTGAGEEAAPQPTPDDEWLATFGDHLVQAGWFREARSVASALAVHDLDRALYLEDRAAAGRGLLGGITHLMRTVDRRGASGGSLASGATWGDLEPTDLVEGKPQDVADLDGVLASMAPIVARSSALLGGESDEGRLAEELRSSPRLEYGSFGALIHPGPWFSKADEKAGLGAAGEPVPGLAELLARLGRFGVFGQMMGGGGPDGTVLQRVLAAERSGEHLGVEWSGTVVWCEGADLKSRAGRLGADISGAALHEGYWIDVDAVRRERGPWAQAEESFLGSGERLRLERALASRGLELTASSKAERDAERISATILLGESDRVRLAVLRDRAAAGSESPAVGLDELLEITSIHEEGHLCDRTRFLPLTRNLPAALGFLMRTGFGPASIARRLEYRAQLVALAEAPDPRLPLVSILGAAEGGTGGVTPHASAYRELLRDLLATLDRELQREPEAWSGIDRDHVLVHQLHFLTPSQLRKLARKQARSEGLFSR